MPSAIQATQSAQAQSRIKQFQGQAEPLQDQFMEILLTQLKYQDPMDPVKETEFLAQMAQFTAATQMQNLNTSVSWLCSYVIENQLGKSLIEAAHLIGKEFKAHTPDGSVAGVVEGAGFSSGRLVIYCGEHEIPIENLIWIGGDVREAEHDQ
ncbi:MAG TPA: flagellar biosynthesis protein FlgD [Firmicutes bacterium]|jgi:flagellar basal-body rod modification protein FlgD|nr:flagellar biosynthesis protein FlgD [Bacillota bacterium]